MPYHVTIDHDRDEDYRVLFEVLTEDAATLVAQLCKQHNSLVQEQRVGTQPEHLIRPVAWEILGPGGVVFEHG